MSTLRRAGLLGGARGRPITSKDIKKRPRREESTDCAHRAKGVPLVDAERQFAFEWSGFFAALPGSACG